MRGAVESVEVADLVTDLQAFAARFEPDVIDTGEVAGVLADLGRACGSWRGSAP